MQPLINNDPTRQTKTWAAQLGIAAADRSGWPLWVWGSRQSSRFGRRAECADAQNRLLPKSANGRAQERKAQKNRRPGRMLGPCLGYNSTASTSATKRPASSLRNEATTLNTASLKPPTFRMSERSGACVVVYGCRSMHTSFGPALSLPCSRTWFFTKSCQAVIVAVEPSETPVGIEPTSAGLQPAAWPFGSSVKYPRQESNLIPDLRRVVCDPPPRG